MMYYTSSVTVGGRVFPASSLVYTGTLYVHGAITASAYHIDQRTVTSGSTYFGNSADDVHIRTGSLAVMSGTKGALAADIAPVLSSSATNHMTYLKSIRGGYYEVTGTVTLDGTDVLSKRAYIFGVTATANTTITLEGPTSTQAKQGHLMVFKDQILARTSSLIVSSSGNGDMIDGSAYYQLTGTMPAINLYSDGTNWFVF
jgi:hypothetical protein|tara:strand:+ start:1928 stop:2530 length:603 start_codon:yes stop_codon:yes gene_type:complete